MTQQCAELDEVYAVMSQSAFMRGFIDDAVWTALPSAQPFESQSAFMRGFIDDELQAVELLKEFESQSAFMRGFIDDGWRDLSVLRGV